MKLVLLIFLFAGLFMLSCSQNEATTEKEYPFTIEQNSKKDFEDSKYNKKEVDSLFVELTDALDTIVMNNQLFYIVEGDITLDSDALYDYCYERIYSKLYDSTIYPKKNANPEFTISLIDDLPEIWPQDKKLTYAVLKNSFIDDPKLYDSAVQFMKDATASWMKVANIQFEHLSIYDTLNPVTNPADPVVFYVQSYASSASFIAKAFFPSDLAFKRKILLQPRFFSPTLAVSKVGILRHELGHVLGARHEHIWSKEAECNKGESVVTRFRAAQQITSYDPYSVMHYLCEKGGTATLELTDFDVSGIQTLYGKKQ